MRAVSRPHTRDIWLWAEPKRTAVVRCGVQAVRSRVARYRTGKVEEGQHIVGDGAVARLICFAIPRPIAVWVETLDTWGEVRRCVGHQGGGLGCERGVRCQFRLYIPSTRCRLAARPDSLRWLVTIVPVMHNGRTVKPMPRPGRGRAGCAVLPPTIFIGSACSEYDHENTTTPEFVDHPELTSGRCA